MDSNSLSHTKWNCKYHIVFAPKYRRKVAYGKIKQDIANILSILCKRKGVKIVEAEICPDHVHMLVEIPPSISSLYHLLDCDMRHVRNLHERTYAHIGHTQLINFFIIGECSKVGFHNQ